ncbi:hypothetical protein RSSE_c3194 [Ralstonia solanacearum]|nr:hypothetical protein RSSE_c3194 [Ralstonia solanacearum]
MDVATSGRQQFAEPCAVHGRRQAQDRQRILKRGGIDQTRLHPAQGSVGPITQQWLRALRLGGIRRCANWRVVVRVEEKIHDKTAPTHAVA